MQDSNTLTIAEIKKRVKSSFVSLTLRQIALRGIGFISINILLIRLLPLETIGIFNIANSIITFFAFFADIGFGASLIQKKEKIEYEDIKTTFTIQQILVFVIGFIIIGGAHFFADFYNLNDEGMWLIRALGLSFILTSLKVIPSVLLERELRFQPLVWVEVLENLIFNVLLVILVLQGFGLWSFSIAAVTRALSGVIVIYIVSPIKIGIGINKISAKTILSFGIPFQLNSFLALIKDRLIPLVVASLITPKEMSYITWSQSLAFLPLEVMNIIIRIAFPAFSRLQEDKEALTKAIDKALFVTSFMVYPFLFGLGAILPSLVTYITQSKVVEAVPSFYLFAFSTYWAVISTTFTNALNAVGQIKSTLRLMIFWTILTWGLTPILVFKYGFIGVGLSSFLISFTSIFTVILIKRLLKVHVLDAIALPTLGSILMSVIVYFFSTYFVRSSWSLVPAILLGGLLYGSFMYIFAYKRLIADLKSLKSD